MLFMGLGTGLGVTLIVDGVVEPTELGHLPYKGGKSFEDFVGERGRKARGNKKWRKTAVEIIEHLKTALEVDYVVLGGGNAVRLKSLPPRCAGWATTATRSSAACACGSAGRRSAQGSAATARQRRLMGRRAGCSRTGADLVQQRQGDRRLLARAPRACGSRRRRDHQRGLLPARRPAADPRSRLHRRRRRRVLGGGQAAVAAQRRARRARVPGRARRAPARALPAEPAHHARASTATCC